MHILFLNINYSIGGPMKKRLLSIAILSLSLSFGIKGDVLPGYENYKPIKPYEIREEKGTLILSNSPETVRESGILYKEKFKKKGRLVFHHVNATQKDDKKLLITIKNCSTNAQLFVINQIGCGPPFYNYLEAGNHLLKAYFKDFNSRVYFLQPNECLAIYDSSPWMWKPNMVLSGMMDIYATDEVEVTFVLTEKWKNEEQIKDLKILERDLAPRGTFGCLTKYQYIEVCGKQDTYYLIEDEVEDWIKGKDSLTGKEAVNYGNYGVLYKIIIYAKEEVEVFICPRGGVFQGTVCWEDGQTHIIARAHAFKTEKERIDIGKIEKGEVRTLNYILPNGSAAPVLIGFDIS